MKTLNATYAPAIFKGIIAFVFVAAGIANLMGGMATDLERLGFPGYFSTIIGVAYLLAVVCIYQTTFLFLQEWAYGGMAVALVGAAASHVFAGDPLANAMPAFILQIIFVVAYVLRARTPELAT
ncbi:MAG: DoxX family protein [Pseudomonadota bacterium]